MNNGTLNEVEIDEKIRNVWLNEGEIKHIIKKVFNIPTHMKPPEEADMAIKVMQKMGYDSSLKAVRKEIENIFGKK